MNPPDSRHDLASLRRLWHRWVAVVELFAMRRRGRRRLSPRAYEVLYGEVLAACRGRGEAAAEGERAFYHGLENLVLPWLNLRAFERANWDILFDLLECCRQAERQLGGGGWFAGARWRAVPLFAGAGAGLLFAGFWALRWTTGNQWGSDLFNPLWLAVKNSTAAERLYAAGGGVIAVSIFLVVRLGRRS
jgi:hypothetical protein